MLSTIYQTFNIKYKELLIEVYKVILCSILSTETYFLLIYIYLNRIINLRTFRIIINSIYNIIVRDKFKKKSRIISSLKKLTKRLKRKTNISINNLETIIIFVALL